MTSIQQREQLQSQIWKIANEVRGAVDGWDFKQFVLGTLFYRFISENFTDYIEGGDDSIDYASLPDSIITPEIKEDAVKTKGYFIYPSQLFANVVKTANTNPNLNTDLKAIFDSIESSANGYASEKEYQKDCLLILTQQAPGSAILLKTKQPFGCCFKRCGRIEFWKF